MSYKSEYSMSYKSVVYMESIEKRLANIEKHVWRLEGTVYLLTALVVGIVIHSIL